ncbi:MAG TPA: GGDEF domain-containing protein [Candidatus Paceibacterota bacterium]|nr:GGDEF domain-containing protein [Candidatus Paceibacterota bacterium]
MKQEKKIADLEMEIERLKKEVYYDELTQIFNRRGFQKEAEPIFKTISYTREEKKRSADSHDFTIMFIDIDDFKKINDVFGHQVGDEVLQKVAKVLTKIMRLNDIVARWGGEEFIIGLVRVGLATADRIAERIREDIKKMDIVFTGNVKVPVTASIGVVGYSHEKTLADLIDRADKAMYQAKQEGKNRVIRLA